MFKTRNNLIKILFCVATFFALCFLCIGFASLQDDLTVNGIVNTEGKEAVLSKTKFRDALRDQNDVTQIYVGNFNDIESANITVSDLTFVADVSDAEQGLGNSVGLYTLANVAYVLALENNSVIFPQNCEYLFANLDADEVSKVNCLQKVTSIDFGSVDMENVSAMYRMFFHCEALKSIELPDSMTVIADAMFRGCFEIESIKLSPRLKSLGVRAFRDCYKLKRINESDTSVSRCNIPETVTSIGDEAFAFCKNVERLNIPVGVPAIGREVFEGCENLKGIVIPNSVTSIGDMAFLGCYSEEFSSLTIPSSVKSIGESAFNTCSGLTSVTIENGLESIGSLAFYNCWRLPKITVPDSVTSVGKEAFKGCPIVEATIPAVAAKAINNIDFDNIDAEGNVNSILQKITVTSGNIESKSFARCGALTSITLANGVTGIGDFAFYNCYSGSLTGISIPGTVENIGESAFSGCGGFTSVSIENGVKTIGNLAFNGCWQLPKITIPDSVISVASDAFYGCPISEASIPAVAAVSVSQSGYLTKVSVTSGATIGSNAFAGCWQLKEITISNSVKSIQENALLNCWQLEKIIFQGTQAEWNAIVKSSEEGKKWNEGCGNYTIEYAL